MSMGEKGIAAAAALARRALAGRLAESILSLYAMQCAAYAVPLVTLPYLAWVLGPAGLGLIAFAQSFAGWVVLLVEYGFNFSATREVAVHRDSPGKRAEILAGVLGAKCLLAAAVVPAALALGSLFEWFRLHPAVLAAGLFWGLAQAFGMSWYFLGLEKMRLVASLDIASRILALAGILALVKKPGDAWKVLALQGAGSGLAAALALAAAWREAGRRLPRWVWVRSAFRRGRGFLLFRAAETLYTSGNALLLGLFAAPAAVGCFAGAEKICRGIFVGLLDPVHRSLYPRVTHLLNHSPERARILVRAGTAAVFALGAALGAGAFLFAGPLVRLLLGGEFAPAAAVLRILAVLPAAIALKWALGLEWMMPLGLEREFNAIIFASAAFHALAAGLLAPAGGAAGMAWAVAATEALIPAAVYAVLRSRDLDPLLPVRPASSSCFPIVTERTL